MAAAAEALSLITVNHRLALIWQRSLPLIQERLARLDAAATRVEAGYLTADARTEACDIAHKLAGSLGMFGYQQGTEIARELEILLTATDPVPGARLDELTLALRRSLSL